MRALKGKARRGRPRQQRDAQDRGTPEIQALRRKLAAGGDAALTEYPLGMLRLRQMIDGDQHEAGCHYAFLYRQAVGRVQMRLRSPLSRTAGRPRRRRRTAGGAAGAIRGAVPSGQAPAAGGGAPSLRGDGRCRGVRADAVDTGRCESGRAGRPAAACHSRRIGRAAPGRHFLLTNRKIII